MVMITKSTVVGVGLRAEKRLLAIILLAALTGCSPALQLKQVWENDAYRSGGLQKVLVICDMTVPTVKRQFENEIVKDLRHHGAQAVESFKTFPEGVPADSGGREAFVSLIREQGYDAVMYTRTMTGRTETREIPGMTIVSGFGSPYGGSIGVAATIGGPSQPTTQGYSHDQGYLTIETLLFDVRTEKRLWAAQSELRLSGTPQDHIKPYVGMIIDKLAKTKLLN